ncbi:MAG: prepilin-type N-terminal cleavage/methylation domain-containing protein [Planctomycetes bacterium]|nr:prepilin-type N-terminal cleavage/methylation domain-containing protein [Planctomycetota bacterium]
MSRSPRAAFTLLEILVAGALVALVAAAALSLLESSTTAKKRIEARAERRSVADGALSRIAADLSGAVATGTATDTGFLGNDEEEDELAVDTLEFLTLAGRPDRSRGAPESDFRRVKYYLDGDEETEDEGLVREELSLLTGISFFGENLYEAEELASEVVELDLQYYDGSAWQDEWDSNVNQGAPRAVRVSVGLSPEEEDSVEEPERWVRVIALPIDRDFQEGGE